MNEVIIAQGAESICANRDEALRLLREGLNLLQQAERHYALAVSGGKPEGSKHYYAKGLPSWDRRELMLIAEGKHTEELVEKYRRSLDSTAWAFLRDVTGLRALMDSEALQRFDDQLAKDPPPLTIETVKSTFRDARDAAGEIFERGLLNVYKAIRDAGHDFKTSDPGELGDRFVLPNALDWYGNGLSWSSGKRSLIDDLERIFFVLDSKVPPEHSVSAGSAINDHSRKHGNRGVVVTPYLEFKLHKNRNVHVVVLSDDVRAKANRIIAKHYPRAMPDDRNRPAKERRKPA
jgi:hypothetical protein